MPSEAPAQRLSLLLEIYSVSTRMNALVERELARDDVPVDGYAPLSTVGAFGPLRLTELASLLGVPLTTMSDVVRRLEARGLVTRRPNPDDRRSSLLELTPTGDDAWRRGWPALRRATEQIEGHLDAPEDEVRAALRRLEAALAAALAGSGSALTDA